MFSATAVRCRLSVPQQPPITLTLQLITLLLIPFTDLPKFQCTTLASPSPLLSVCHAALYSWLCHSSLQWATNCQSSGQQTQLSHPDVFPKPSDFWGQCFWCKPKLSGTLHCSEDCQDHRVGVGVGMGGVWAPRPEQPSLFHHSGPGWSTFGKDGDGDGVNDDDDGDNGDDNQLLDTLCCLQSWLGLGWPPRRPDCGTQSLRA